VCLILFSCSNTNHLLLEPDPSHSPKKYWSWASSGKKTFARAARRLPRTVSKPKAQSSQLYFIWSQMFGNKMRTPSWPIRNSGIEKSYHHLLDKARERNYSRYQCYLTLLLGYYSYMYGRNLSPGYVSVDTASSGKATIRCQHKETAVFRTIRIFNPSSRETWGSYANRS